MTQPRFSVEQKRKAVELSYVKGVSLADAAKRSQCSLASLMNWRRSAKHWVDHTDKKDKRAGATLAHNGNGNGGMDPEVVVKEVTKPSPSKDVIILQYLIEQLQDMVINLTKLIEKK